MLHFPIFKDLNQATLDYLMNSVLYKSFISIALKFFKTTLLRVFSSYIVGKERKRKN